MPVHIQTDTGDVQHGDRTVQCPICLQPIGVASDDGVIECGILLPCGHCYGHDCLRNWIQQPSRYGQPRSCPNCRHDIPLAIRQAISRMREPIHIRPPPAPAPFSTARHARNFQIGHMTTDELPGILRAFYPFESLLQTIQRMPMRAFREVQAATLFSVHGMPRLVPENPMSLAMYTILMLYTPQELDRIEHLFYSPTNPIGRNSPTMDLHAVEWLRVFSEVAIYLRPEDRDGEWRVGPSLQNEELVRILLRPTNRAPPDDHRFNTAIQPLEYGNAQTTGILQSANEEEHEPTEHEPTEASSLIPPAGDRAFRNIVNGLRLGAFASMWSVLRNSPDYQESSARQEHVVRRLYAPAEIRAIVERMAQLHWIAWDHEVYRRRTRDLRHLFLRPAFRALVFNGDSTLYGPSTAAGGEPPSTDTQDSLEAIAKRNRMRSTPIIVFLRAASDDPIDSAHENDEGVMHVSEVRTMYTELELLEIWVSLRHIHGANVARGDRNMLPDDSQYWESINMADVYRVRLEEILFRPIARAREREELQLRRLQLQQAQQTTRSPRIEFDAAGLQRLDGINNEELHATGLRLIRDFNPLRQGAQEREVMQSLMAEDQPGPSQPRYTWGVAAYAHGARPVSQQETQAEQRPSISVFDSSSSDADDERTETARQVPRVPNTPQSRRNRPPSALHIAMDALNAYEV